MFVTIDAGGMAIRKADLQGVIADDGSGLRTRFRLEHRQCWKGVAPWRRGGESFFFAALVITCGAGTLFPQVREIIVAGVAIGPSDVDSSPGLYMHFHGGRLSSRIDWNGHA